MNKEKLIKDLQAKSFKEFTAGMSGAMDVLNENVKLMADELLKIHKPKDSKEIEINGKKVKMALTTDGRIFIVFPDTDSAEAYFARPKIFNKDERLEYGCEMFVEGKAAMQLIWENKSWFKRLFY